MPALFPLRLALTKEQNEWLKQRFFERETSPLEIVLGLLEAEIRGENITGRLAELVRLGAESEARSRRLEASLAAHQEVITAYLHELFRESRANLYRLESIIADMPDAPSVRRMGNEFVRSHEREMAERVEEIRHRLGHLSLVTHMEGFEPSASPQHRSPWRRSVCKGDGGEGWRAPVEGGAGVTPGSGKAML